ncbi:MAG: HAD family hydrolase [Eubacterium sp.]|jgi:HAD superfamily hydrolase (TIGR01509 family)
MAIKGALFDLDGTLVDSMRAWNQAPITYLAQFGIKAPEDIGDKLFALTLEDSAEYVKREYGLDLSTDEIADGINGVIQKYYMTEAMPKEGAFQTLEAMFDAGIRMVIGSSTAKYLVTDVVRRLGMTRFFDAVLTCSEIGAPKSEPDLFIKAAEIMGTKPEETLVVEDGLYSLKEAASLGMKTAGVYDYVSRNDRGEMMKIADIYVDQGQNLTKILTLIGGQPDPDEGFGSNARLI